MSFDRAVEFVLRYEGGYSNDPEDPGGETKFGISKRAYPSLDIKNLTSVQAKEIYLNDYWNKCKCSELPQGIAFSLFDSAVNLGCASAVRLLQQALEIPDDGKVGAITIGMAFRSSETLVLKEFMARRAFHYACLPTIHRFGLGWYRRLLEGYQIALEP